MNTLSGQELQKLYVTIVEQFDVHDFDMMLRVRLNVQLDMIVPSRQPFPILVYEVIRYFEMQGRLLELTESLVQSRPKEGRFNEFLQLLRSSTPEPGIISEAQAREMADALADAFDLSELQMLVQDYLGWSLPSEVNTQAPFKKLVQETVERIVERKQIEKLLGGIAKERPHNPRVRDLIEKLVQGEAVGDPVKPLVLTPEQSRDLVEAVTQAFNKNDLEQLTYIQLDTRLEDAVNTNAPFRVIVRELVEYLRRRGQTEPFIRALAAARAENHRVRAMLEQLGLAADTSGLERIIGESHSFIDMRSFRSRLTKFERCVCRVESVDRNAKILATGFLVGPDTVMTCHHILPVADNVGSMRFRFDYRLGNGGVDGGRLFAALATHGLLASSGADALDYMIIRLESRVDPERGFIRLPATPSPVVPGTAVFILQHPSEKSPLLTVDPNGVIASSPDGRFVYLRTTTEPGSSGSPVLNTDWDLIGLRHGAKNVSAGTVNVAVSITAIIDDLRNKAIRFDDNGAVECEPVNVISGPDLLDEPEPTEESAALACYRKAAAVQLSFDIGKLRPLPPAEPDELAAVQLMSECSFRTDPVRGPRYSLRPDLRQATLQEMTANELRGAVLENRELPEELPQRLFSSLVLGEPLPDVAGEVQRLRDLLQATVWLRGKFDNLPNETLLRQRIAREELLAPHRHLAGRNFQGRAYELFRLGALVDGEGDQPLLLHGIGGTGKSALIARFLLARIAGADARQTFVFIDFDRTDLVAEEPITLLAEAVRQIGAQHAELVGDAADLVATWEATIDRARSAKPAERSKSSLPALARYAVDEGNRREIHVQFLGFLRRVLLPGDRLLLVLDTFEEVQTRSRDAVDRFWEFLAELRTTVPGLRVIVSGRAEWENRLIDQLPLGDLDPDAARRLVVAEGIPLSTASKLVELVGGNPLCLQLAMEVLRRDGLEAIDGLSVDDVAVGGAIRSQLVQGLLYKRILAHVRDGDVRKLAFPGLTLRRIDPGVIREVLAGPCGLNVPDDATADDLFTRLSKEVALVQPGRAGALYHRPDVRRVMLSLLRSESAGRFEAINRAAAEYYRLKTAGHTFPDPADRAEEIYHRLAAGDPIKEVDLLWTAGVEEFLRRAVEDFSTVGPATFLASRLGVEVPPELWNQSRLEDWERRVAKRADDLVRLGDPAKALLVLKGRPERSPASVLYGIEARLRLDLSDPVSAIRVASAGLESSVMAANKAVKLDLMLFLADALWVNGERMVARSTCEAAIDVAEQLPDPICSIDALTRLLRFCREINVRAEESTVFRTRLGERLKALSRSSIHSNVLLVRQAAVEALPDDPDAVRYVEGMVGIVPELTQNQIGLIWDQLRKLVELSPGARAILGTEHPAFVELVLATEHLAPDVLVKLENDSVGSTTRLVRLLISTPILIKHSFVALLRLLLERPLPGMTDTRGWSEHQLSLKLEAVKMGLDWQNTTGSARKWWEAFENENKSKLTLVLRLVEELAVRKATISELFLAYVYSNTDSIQANLSYLDYTRLKKKEERKKRESAARSLSKSSSGGAEPPPVTNTQQAIANDWWLQTTDLDLPSGLSSTRNGSDEGIRTRLEQVKVTLDWASTTGSARKWWDAIEQENGTKLQLVLGLAEELANRRATITEFFQAFVYSNTEDIQANLHYLDFMRLKKEEERKQKEAAVDSGGQEESIGES
jgi:cellulose synthase operon protein C